jgi:hypothetical protein
METKKCFKCGEVKALSFFYKHPQMAGGRVNKCKECNKIDVRTNRADKIDYYKEYDKRRAMTSNRVIMREEYAKTEDGMAAYKRARDKWQKNNPIKKAASQIVNNAVRDGRLEKPSRCECCGSRPERLHGHHDDYAFPMVVRWICPGCHSKWHRENGEGANAH